MRLVRFSVPALPNFLLRYGAVAPVLVLSWWLAVSATWDKSTTFDEILHLTAGTSYWIAHDYRLHPENGKLRSHVRLLHDRDCFSGDFLHDRRRRAAARRAADQGYQVEAGDHVGQGTQVRRERRALAAVGRT